MGEDYVLLMGLSLIWKTKSTLLLTPRFSGFFILRNMGGETLVKLLPSWIIYSKVIIIFGLSFLQNSKLPIVKRRQRNDLAVRLRNDDISAFNTLYWEYHGAVYANAFKLIRDAVVSEDIVQEVFVTLWEKRHKIDPKQDIAGWLFVVSHHKTIDQLKRKLRHTLAEKILQAVVEDSGAADNDFTDEQLGAIERAVDQLSPQKRKVFELCKMQKRTYENAAEELHISKYTVKEYLSEAMISIKKYIVQHPTHAGVLVYFFALIDTFLCNYIL